MSKPDNGNGGVYITHVQWRDSEPGVSNHYETGELALIGATVTVVAGAWADNAPRPMVMIWRKDTLEMLVLG